MPGRTPDAEHRLEALFDDLGRVHDLLQAYQDRHQKTGYGCMRSGNCCQVGLQLPVMECEHIARHVLATTEGDPTARRRAIARLKRAFDDPKWTWAGSIGERMCAFYDKGCTIHPERPSICRMYGVVLEADDHCPRDRLSNGKGFVYVQKDVDRLVALYYKTLDEYGRIHPDRDYTVYMPAGVLGFLLTPAALARFRAKTAPKFWKRERGYRTQFVPSYRRGQSVQTNVRFSFAIPQAR